MSRPAPQLSERSPRRADSEANGVISARLGSQPDANLVALPPGSHPILTTASKNRTRRCPPSPTSHSPRPPTTRPRRINRREASPSPLTLLNRSRSIKDKEHASPDDAPVAPGQDRGAGASARRCCPAFEDGPYPGTRPVFPRYDVLGGTEPLGRSVASSRRKGPRPISSCPRQGYRRLNLLQQPRRPHRARRPT